MHASWYHNKQSKMGEMILYKESLHRPNDTAVARHRTVHFEDAYCYNNYKGENTIQFWNALQTYYYYFY